MIKRDELQQLSGYFAVMSSNPQDLIKALRTSKVTALHATNGVYGAPAKFVLPTTLAGFQYLDDTHEDKDAGLLVALNSDISMARAGAPVTEGENQYDRARKIVPYLATQFPNRRVFYTFYDEADPAKLYGALSEAGINLPTLHKWGYGTDPDAPTILGSQFFQKVYGFPLPKKTEDTKPAFWSMTPKGENRAFSVVDLSQPQPSGRAYISADNQVLFKLAPAVGKHAAIIAPPSV